MGISERMEKSPTLAAGAVYVRNPAQKYLEENAVESLSRAIFLMIIAEVILLSVSHSVEGQCSEDV